MTAQVRLGIAVIVLLVLTNLALAGEGPTKADIPAGLSPELRALIEQTFSPEPKKRADAAVRLGKMGEKAAPAVPFLIRLSDDGTAISEETEGQVCFTAREALGAIGLPAVEPLIAALRRSSGVTRLDLLDTLEHVADRRVVAEFLSLLKDPDEDCRRRAAEDMERVLERNPESHNSPGVIQSLIRTLEDRDPQVRSSIAEALGKTRNPTALEPLVKMLDDANPSVRTSVISALGDLGDPRAWDVLKKTMRNASWQIRHYGEEGYTAARSLGQLRGGKPAIGLLISTARASSEAIDIRCGAICGLAELADRRAVETLLTLLKKEEGEPPRVRESAVWAIGKIQRREAIPVLKELALNKNEAPLVRFAAAVSLVNATHGEVDDTAIVKVIAAYRSHGDDLVGEPSLKEIAAHGRTKEIRSAAQAELKRIRTVIPWNESPPKEPKKDDSQKRAVPANKSKA